MVIIIPRFNLEIQSESLIQVSTMAKKRFDKKNYMYIPANS